MLRWKMGDDAFFEGIQNYLNDPLLQDGFAKTPDFQAHMENSSGLSLNDYFDKWFFGEGFPSYNVLWHQNGNNITFTVDQTTSHPSVSFYDMPIALRVVGGTKDTILIFDHSFSGETFSATIDFNAIYVNFDPDKWLISANNTVTLGIEENTDWEVRLYPNPANDFIVIDNLPSGIKMEDLEILDINGRSVLNLIQIQLDTQRIELNIALLPAGNYTIKLTNEKGEGAYRFMKNR